jgi:hypothetical protein
MAKPRYRLVRLCQLNPGDVFWSLISGRAIKGDKIYYMPREVFKGRLIHHTNGGEKVKILESPHLSTLGFEMHTSKDRQVFVEVDNG